jgi:DNA-binding SARP family transcriptional activator
VLLLSATTRQRAASALEFVEVADHRGNVGAHRPCGQPVCHPPRALLALLALDAPQPVAADTAAEQLWPKAAPAEALRTLQVTMSRLRRSLTAAGPMLETTPSGYRLAVDADAIDARRFESLLHDRAGRADLEVALALWRGLPLADLAFESFAQAEIARLEELHLLAQEQLLDLRLAEGEHALVVPELERLAVAHPSRERLVSMLMLALYRSGRQADALDTYQRARHRLDDELGLEPSPALQRLQQLILRQAAELEPQRSGAVAAGPTIPRPTSAPGHGPLIGRARERAALDDALGRLAVGHGGFVLIAGEAGVGKTRFVEDSATRAPTTATAAIPTTTRSTSASAELSHAA